MGSDSDWPVMQAAGEILTEFGVAWEADVVSAHRMPDRDDRRGASRPTPAGCRSSSPAPGERPTCPGMLASVTPLPVIGVPVPLKYLDGMDSLLSIVQMPGGIPVATVAIGNAKNAGILAARILATSDPDLQQRLVDYQAELAETAHAKGDVVRRAAAGDNRRVGF